MYAHVQPSEAFAIYDCPCVGSCVCVCVCVHVCVCVSVFLLRRHTMSIDMKTWIFDFYNRHETKIMWVSTSPV